MGDADSSRTSKGKGVLGGLVSSLKRVAGNKKDDEEPVKPRTGVSLRDRFSALRPSAAPTEPVPQKVSEDIPDPDSGKEVKVIQTSAVRSSGSVRFSDRIGVAVSSESEEGYDRKIIFDDGKRAVTEEMPEDNGTIETGPKGRAVAEEVAAEDIPAAKDAFPAADRTDAIPDTIELDVIEDTKSVTAPIANDMPAAEPAGTTVKEPIVTKAQAEERKAPVEEKRPLFEIRRSPIEEKKAPAEEKKAPAEERKPLFELKRAPVEEKKAPAEERKAPAEIKKETAVEKNADIVKEEAPKANAPDDGFDEGYDFLPRRSRFFGSEKKAAPKETVHAPEPKKESTALSQRLKAKHTEPAPKKTSEVQIDGPVKHEGVTRTSLLDKVLRKKAPAKSVSDVIIENEKHTGPEKIASAVPEEIEECDADVAAAAASAAAVPEERTFVDVTDEKPAEEVPIAADTECADNVGISDGTFVTEEAETKEEVPEEAVVEATDGIPGTEIEVEAEETAAKEEVPEEAVIEATEEMPVTEIEVEAEEIPEAATEAEAIPEVAAEVAEEVIEVTVEAEAIPEVAAEVAEEVPEAVIEVAEEIPEAVVEAAVEYVIPESVPDFFAEMPMEEYVPKAVPKVVAEYVIPESVPDFFAEMPAEEVPEVAVAAEAIPEVVVVAKKTPVVREAEVFPKIVAKMVEKAIAEAIVEAVTEEAVLESAPAFFAEMPAEEYVPKAGPIVSNDEVSEEVIETMTALPTEEAAAEEETAAQPPTHYLKEIEGDAPSADMIDTDADVIEESVTALLNGIAVDGGIIATEDACGDVCAEAHSEVCVTEPISVTAANATAAVISEALAICFSFRSEGLPPSPSASMRFVWGR